jgi:hypothetical protein
MPAVAALNDTFDLLTVLVLPCAVLLLLIWGLSRLFGPLGLSKWTENMRVALALAVVVGFFLFCGFMAISIPEPRVSELKAEMQEVRIERDKVRIGMKINDVLPLVHGMDITAEADGAWLSVLPDNKRFYYSPGILEAWQNDNGTFAVSCYCGTEQVSRNEKVSESKAAALLMWNREEQVVQNLTASQAAELMRQKMSDGFEWSWQYKTFKRSRQYVFTVTFGRDERVNHISDVWRHGLTNQR